VHPNCLDALECWIHFKLPAQWTFKRIQSKCIHIYNKILEHLDTNKYEIALDYLEEKTTQDLRSESVIIECCQKE